MRVERRGEGVVLWPALDGTARPFETLTDEQWDRAWEQPMREAIATLQRVRREGAGRIVVVVPTTSMSGGAQYAHVAATGEALRVLVKSAARQWGADGITVNAVAVAPELVLTDPAAAGPVSLAPPALSPPGNATAVIDFLCSAAAGDVTGQTVTVDGGRWM